MWYIQLSEDITHYSACEFAGHQLLDKHIVAFYDNLENNCGTDYKMVKSTLIEQILFYINNIPDKTVELYVYNYGIDNAIVLLNHFNNNSITKKYANTTSRNLLFAIFYSRYKIYYIPSAINYTATYMLRCNYPLAKVLVIQRVWRKVLAYRKEVKLETVNNDITYLIDKINNEITGEPSKRVLIYLVNKFRRRLSKTL